MRAYTKSQTWTKQWKLPGIDVVSADLIYRNYEEV